MTRRCTEDEQAINTQAHCHIQKLKGKLKPAERRRIGAFFDTHDKSSILDEGTITKFVEYLSDKPGKWNALDFGTLDWFAHALLRTRHAAVEDSPIAKQAVESAVESVVNIVSSSAQKIITNVKRVKKAAEILILCEEIHPHAINQKTKEIDEIFAEYFMTMKYEQRIDLILAGRINHPGMNWAHFPKMLKTFCNDVAAEIPKGLTTQELKDEERCRRYIFGALADTIKKNNERRGRIYADSQVIKTIIRNRDPAIGQRLVFAIAEIEAQVSGMENMNMFTDPLFMEYSIMCSSQYWEDYIPLKQLRRAECPELLPFLYDLGLYLRSPRLDCEVFRKSLDCPYVIARQRRHQQRGPIDEWDQRKIFPLIQQSREYEMAEWKQKRRHPPCCFVPLEDQPEF